MHIDGFDFAKKFKCSDLHKFAKLNTLSIDIFELNFHQDQNDWKQKLIPIEVSKKDSDGVIDLLFLKTHYALIKKLNVFVGGHQKHLYADDV